MIERQRARILNAYLNAFQFPAFYRDRDRESQRDRDRDRESQRHRDR